jgi:surface protein
MNYMFFNNSAFNQSIGSWDVSAVTTMYSMFRVCIFNQNIGSWDVSSVTTTYRMFNNNTIFNNGAASGVGTNALNWNMSVNTTTQYMFSGSSAFNSPCNFTNTQLVVSLQYMFEDAIVFNQPITFNTDGVVRLSAMFARATAFNQNVGNLNITNIDAVSSLKHSFLYNTGISVTNYDDTLKGWASQSTPTSNVTIETNADYSTDGSLSKSILENTYGWAFQERSLVGIDKTFTSKYTVQGLAICKDPVYITTGGAFSLLSNLNLKHTLVEASTYTVDSTDLVIGVVYAGTVTITLPPAVLADYNSISNGKLIIILDESGNVEGETNKITIAADGSDTIIGNSSVEITTAYTALKFLSNGVDAWVIL